jgi:hypothetical protein
MIYYLVKYLAEKNHILILRGSRMIDKNQKIFNYWALIPPFTTILSVDSVLNNSLSLIRLMDRDDMIILSSSLSSSSTSELVTQQLTEQNQFIEEQMNNYLSNALPLSFGKPSDYNPNLYSKGLSRGSRMVSICHCTSVWLYVCFPFLGHSFPSTSIQERS